MLVVASHTHFLALQSGAAPAGLTLVPGNVGSPDIIEMLGNLAETFRPIFDPCAWMIVDRGEIVGLLSVVQRPQPGSIHIGYGIASPRRHQGLATKAVASLLDWARAEPRLDRVTADTSVGNTASQRVLERNGFVQIGTRVDDEDGPLICWEATTA